jgi:CheY-like chemotaxis protein
MIVAVLGSGGYEVTTAGGSEDGLRLARESGFDLIILDYKYEDRTGEELCRLIRQSDSDTRSFSSLAWTRSYSARRSTTGRRGSSSSRTLKGCGRRLAE